MGTGLDGAIEECTAGIVPRSVEYLRQRLDALGSDSIEYELYVSFLEIYNEEIIDLLNAAQQPDAKNRKGILAIREDSKGEIFVTGIREDKVTEPEGIIECLRNGSLCRTTKSTQMNLVSSRSHAIFTISLRQRRRVDDSMEWKNYVSKLHFVDLAGSERLKRTMAQGDRAKESISINSGLLALGNVISALGDESKKGAHVPYRDSKLTRLLQDSLGGNSRTLMIACVSPSSDNLQETLNTLKYAHRARNIKNKVHVTQDAAGDAAFEVVQLKKQVAALKQQLNQIRSAPMRSSSSTENLSTARGSAAQDSKLKRENEDLKRRLDVMTREKRLVEQERDALKGALNNDPTRSPKTKEYLRTISELRSRIVQMESKASNISSSGPATAAVAGKKLGAAQRPGGKKQPVSPVAVKIEPGTPKWFRAADDLLDRAKTEIEQAYDAMDNVYDGPAPSAFLVEDDDEDDAKVVLGPTKISPDQLAAAVATRTEHLMGQVRLDCQIRAELIQQIEVCKQEFLFMRERFEERISLLQTNMKAVQAERDQALLRPVELDNESRAGLNRLTRQKYEERIKKLGKEINELKDRLRQSLHTTSSKTNANDTLIRNLRSSLTNLKIENGRLQTQINDQLGKLKSHTSDQESALCDLRASTRRATESARKWKRAHEFQKALLQKRIEQCLHARAKIRQLVGLLRRNRVNLGSPSVGIDWGSPGWKALQGDHPSPLLPSRLLKSGGACGDAASLGDDVPTNELTLQQGSPVRKFPLLSNSQLGQKSISASDIGEDPSDGDLADATSQLMIDSDPPVEPDSPFLASSSHRTSLINQPQRNPSPLSPLRVSAAAAAPSADYPKSILRASPLLPRRRDFFGRLADAAAAILSPSKQQPPPKKPHS